MNQTPTSVKTEIARRNKTFTKANMQRRRILIAKDIIAQIKAKKVLPSEGSWYYSYNLPAVGNFQKDFLSEPTVNCTCCALGAVLVSCALFKNSVNNKDAPAVFDASNAIESNQDQFKIKQIFGEKQLFLIELAFEQGYGYFSQAHARKAGATNEEISKAIQFGLCFSNAESRMLAIMNNILNNKGTFKP